MPFLGAPSRGNAVQQETAAHESEYLSYTGIRIHPRCFKTIEVSSAYSQRRRKMSLSPNVAVRRTWGAKKSTLSVGFWQVSFSGNVFRGSAGLKAAFLFLGESRTVILQVSKADPSRQSAALVMTT